MHRRLTILGCTLAVAAMSWSGVAAQQPDPNSPRARAAGHLNALLASTGPEALARFVDEHVSPALRSQVGDETLRRQLDELRRRYAGARPAGMARAGEFTVRVMFSGASGSALDPIEFELDAAPPHRFVRIGPIGSSAAAGDRPGRGESSAPPPVASLEELPRYLEAEVAAGRFAGVVLVARGDDILFHESYGLADRTAKQPNRKDTRFNIGSINKLFTAAAVYQLVERGLVGLDDPLGKHLPQFPEPARSTVTIQHLLDHRSGWGAYWGHPEWLKRRQSLRRVADYLEILKDTPLDFAPGTRQQYSNVGYEVLGGVVEAASGQDYYEYMRAHVYQPAGMTDTDAYERDRGVPNLAVGYVGPGAETNADVLAVKGTPAGGGYSTALDMFRFARALRQGRLLSERHAARFLNRGAGGGAPGVNAMLEMGVAGDHVIVVLANASPPAAERIASAITRLLDAGRRQD